ncbi:MAG TPA: hypothetical protein VHY08_21970 [Bacillota bacterium]|nr:hypothetical protein [Bacillota bacterium]
MKDKFMGGIASGFAGSIVKDMLGVIFLYVIKLTRLTYWDYAGYLVLLRQPKGAIEHLFSTFVELLFGMSLGVIYAYLAPLLSCKYNLIKGAAYGTFIWFAISMAVLVFKLNIEGHARLNTAIANFLTAVAYGVVTAIANSYFNEKSE